MRERDSSGVDDENGGYELGVLVVHGIGDQRQGATLTTWVDALAHWFEGRGIDARVRRAVLHPPEGPAQVQLRVSGGLSDQNWLFAEGWWANTFAPPSFGELWGWSFISVPATAALHANTMVVDALRRLGTAIGPQKLYEATRLVAMIAFLLFLVMMSPIILGLLTLLLILGLLASLLPIDALRTAVMKVQLISIGTIGDTKRLIDSPTHSGAIKSPVVDGIEWLRDQGCERVIILAHSQGAAVAYKTLVDIGDGLYGNADERRIDSFISVGSGLPKVHALQYLSSPAGRFLRTAAMLVPLAALAMAACGRFLRQHGNFENFLVITGIGLLALSVVGWLQVRLARSIRISSAQQAKLRAWQATVTLVAVIAAGVYAIDRPYSFVTLVAATALATFLTSMTLLATTRIPPITNALEGATDRWMDLWGSVDPVPAGSTRTTVTGRPESWRVTNLGSLMRDHNSYTDNIDECLSFIGTELGDTTGALDADDRSRLRLRRNERRWRVGWRSFASYAMVAAAAMFAWTTGDSGDNAVADWYARAMHPNGLLNTWYPGDLPGFVPKTLSEPMGDGVAIAGYLLIAIVAAQVANAAWANWNAAAEAEHLRRQSEIDEPDDPDVAHGRFAAMIGLVAFAWFIAVVPQWVWKSWRALDLSSWRGAGVLAGAIAAALAVGWTLPVVLERTNIKRWAMRRDTSRIDGLIAYGDYQLRRLDDPDGAVESFGVACTLARQAGHRRADAHAGHARALAAQAAGLRRSGADTSLDPTHRASCLLKAALHERECLAAHERALADPNFVTSRYRVDYVEHLYAFGEDDSAPMIDQQLLLAFHDSPRDPKVQRAMVSYLPEVADGELGFIAESLSGQLDQLDPTDELQSRYALLVAGGPQGPDRHDHEHRLAELLGAAHRAPLAQLGWARDRLRDTDWPEADADHVIALGELMTARVGDVVGDGVIALVESRLANGARP